MLRKIEYQGDFPELENYIQFSIIEVQTKEVVIDEFTEPEEYKGADSNLRNIHSRHGFILPSCYMG